MTKETLFKDAFDSIVDCDEDSAESSESLRNECDSENF